jgi:hypothetical protein
MSYTVKANELINWVDRAIDRQKAGSQRSKVILAMQTPILLAGILRSEHPSYPHEEHSYKIYWNARKLLKKVDPELDARFHQIISQKSKSKGRFNIYGVEAIYASNVFKKFTTTKSKSLESAVKKANTDKCSYLSNYLMVENWCNVLGLPIDLVRLDDTDLDNLHSYLNAIGENA